MLAKGNRQTTLEGKEFKNNFVYRVKPIYAWRPFIGTSANDAKPDQTPQNAASDLVLHCLLTEVSIFSNLNKDKKNTP